MGFVWVQDISIGADILSLDIVEIRDAADFVLDNLCVADNVPENVGENGLHLIAEDGAENSNHNTGEDGAENSNDNTAEDGAENSDDNAGEDGAENSNDNPALNGVENASDNPAQDGTVNSGDNPALDGTDNLTQDGSALPANHDPDNMGVNYLEDSFDHGPNYWTQYPTAVVDEYGSGDDSAAQSNV